MNPGCEKCEYKDLNPHKEPCVNCWVFDERPNFVPHRMTKGDLIRAMSDRKLAELLFQRGNGQEYCYGICVRQDECESGPDDRRICIDNIVKWLKSPVEEAQT